MSQCQRFLFKLLSILSNQVQVSQLLCGFSVFQCSLPYAGDKHEDTNFSQQVLMFAFLALKNFELAFVVSATPDSSTLSSDHWVQFCQAKNQRVQTERQAGNRQHVLGIAPSALVYSGGWNCSMLLVTATASQDQPSQVRCTAKHILPKASVGLE